MQFEGAVVRERGQTFGIVVVKPYVLHDKSAQATIRQLGIRAATRGHTSTYFQITRTASRT